MGKYDWVLSALSGLGFRDKLSLIKKFLSDRKKVEDIVKCSLCPNMCRFNCPIATVLGDESVSPAGKARIALAIRRGYLEAAEENVLPLYYCLGCGACKAYCVFGFNVAELLIPLKEELYENGKAPGAVFKLAEKLKNYGSIYGERPVGMAREGKVLLLLGETLRRKYPELEEKYVKILEVLGFSVKTLEIEPYCGLLPYYNGMRDVAEKLYSELVDTLRNSKADFIVVSEPSCAYLLRHVIEKYGLKLKKKVLHISELIYDRLDELRFKEANVEVVLHEPCALIFKLERENILREILARIPNLKLKLPFRNGKNAFCVGGTEILEEMDREVYERLINERLQELKEEAELIITSSPSCMKKLEEAGGKVIDLVDFLLNYMEV